MLPLTCERLGPPPAVDVKKALPLVHHSPSQRLDFPMRTCETWERGSDHTVDDLVCVCGGGVNGGYVGL